MAQKKSDAVLPQPHLEKLERASVFVIGLALALLPLFFWVNTQDQFELPKLTLLRLLSVALVGLYAAQLGLSPRWIFRRTVMDLPLLAWSLWLVFKTLNSVSPAVSWRGEYENFAGSLTQLNYSLLFFATVQGVRNLNSARALLLTLEASALAAGTYAIFQALQLDFVSWASASVVIDRYFSSLGNPNFLGALMIMALALLAARAFWSQLRPSNPRLWAHWAFMLLVPLAWLALYAFYPPPQGHRLDFTRIRALGQPGAQATLFLYLLGMAGAGCMIWMRRSLAAARLLLFLEAMILLKALADTGTRGAFAGLLALVSFFAVLSLRRLWRRQAARGVSPLRRGLNVTAVGLAVLVALGGVSLTLGAGLRQRMGYTLTHPLRAFDESRMQIWIPAIHIAKDFPLSGTGVDTFKTVFPQYSRSKFAKYDGDNVASRMAHCEPLQILATMGLIGLALWAWLLLSWGLAWLRLWRGCGEGGADADIEKMAVLAGLGGLTVAYLVQNLVSFGVSAISAPFFICLGLLGAAGTAWERGRWRPRFAQACLLGLLLPGAAWGCWAAAATFRADLLYNFGHLVASQLPALASAQAREARNAAAYAIQELKQESAGLDAWQRQEIDAWYARLASAETKDPNGPEALATYRDASLNLFLLLSSARQSRAVQLAPSEVKYHVYLGLAYEELAKRSQNPGQKLHWFESAQHEYLEGVRLNPRNAYYHGNLGRLYALRAQDSAPEFLPKAEENYLAAVRLAPVTKLFYENLILQYARYGDLEKCGALLAPVEGRDPGLASQLYLEAAGTFTEIAQSLKDQKDKKIAALLKAASARFLAKAKILDLQDPSAVKPKFPRP
jgi:O-antigen ligase